MKKRHGLPRVGGQSLLLANAGVGAAKSKPGGGFLGGDSRDIPTTLADITPAWLTAALANVFPGVTVQSLTTETLHDGTAFTCRLHVTYHDTGPAGPATVCLKAGMDAPHRDFVFKAGLCCKEAMVYQDVLPKTRARVAACFASGYETASGKGYVLLEDLTPIGAAFCSAEEPLTPEQVASGLEQLAELHALFWNDRSFEEPRWRHRGRSLGEADPLEKLLLEALPRAVHTPHGGAVARQFIKPDIMGPAIARLRALDHASATSLIHGDAHLGNFFLNADRQPCMADFQCVQRGHYTHDVAMFIGSSLDVLDRRQHEHALVRHYLAALGQRGVAAPSFEDAWLGYRRHMLYGLWGWLLTTDTFQPEGRIVRCVFRFGLAALDLDSLEAIGA